MTLDTLLDSAEHVAREVMFKEREQLPPTWILSDGKETKEIATPWRDDLERAIAKIFIADIIKEYKTVAYSFVSEVWVATETKEEYESGKPYVQPRHRPDRKEMVMAFATDGTKVVGRSWSIVRNWDDQVIKLALDTKLQECGVQMFFGSMISLLGTPRICE